jgi:peptide/nickel transport system substrate-binding protein
VNKENLKKIFLKERSLPKSEIITKIRSSFKTSEKVLFYSLALLLIFSGLVLLYRVNENFLIEVPAQGGQVVEGVVGSPRFLNPILAISDADRDLTSIVYSGLLKSDGNYGVLENLAESYKISTDGLVYTFILKPNIYFHDGHKITTDDVEFTIQKIKDADIKSPKRSNFENITVEKVDQRIIKFVLKQPYSPFIQNLTVGILPKHIWKNIDNEGFAFSSFNIKPIGSGPYKIDSVLYDQNGLPKEYSLISFKKYIFGKPFVDKINIKFYADEEDLLSAYKKGEVSNINSISPENIKKLDKKNTNLITSPLPRIFGVFFNQNSAPIFINKEVRLALDKAVDKNNIIDSILSGFGKAINGPLPESTEEKLVIDNIAEARKILEDAGWKLNELGVYEKKTNKDNLRLSFSISTADTTELKKTAMLLQETWQKMGAEVELKVFEIGDLNQNIIRPRKYDALLFGEIINKNLDLYPFWHSSQRIDPGLNIAMYTNIKTDKILEDIRKTIDQDKKEILIKDFASEIRSDSPAIFIYSPYFIYLHDNKIKNIKLGDMTIPGERFSNIEKWYIETNKIWSIFKR